jgi:S-DNA-T family DNA segregation ATPase FtsK/SpoIIIE
VEHIAKFIGDQKGFPTPYELPEYIDPKEAANGDRALDMGERDELFEEAARLIVRNQIGSTSLIQRKLALGYARSGRLMDQLENAGIVGPNLGSKAREVYIKTEEELERILQDIA